MAQYVDIQSASAVAEASYDQLVVVSAKIVNLYSATISVDVKGKLEYGVSPWPDISFSYFPKNLDAGAYQWTSNIIHMPNHDLRVHIYSYWYGSDGQWHLDEEEIVEVDLLEVDYAFSIGVPTVGVA